MSVIKKGERCKMDVTSGPTFVIQTGSHVYWLSHPLENLELEMLGTLAHPTRNLLKGRKAGGGGGAGTMNE